MHAKTFDFLSQKPVQIEQEDGFFGRVLSKETAIANSSFKVYYGGSSGAVPFRWESEPGTPKHPCFEASLPPLTPPPSYYLSSFSNFNSNSMNKPYSKSNLLKTIFKRISPKRTHNPTSSAISIFSQSSSSALSSWSSSRSSSCSSQASGSPSLKETKRCRFTSPNLTYFFDQKEDEHQKVPASSPTSSESCPGISSNPFRGCTGRMVKAKSAFASILGHESAKTASAF